MRYELLKESRDGS